MNFLRSIFKPLMWSKIDEELCVTDDGFEIVSGNAKRSELVFWHDIIKVQCYKRDLLTVDDLCVKITFLRNQEPWTHEISEETCGFKFFISQLGKHVPLNPLDWYSKTIRSPFARNQLTLFENEENKQE